MLSEEATIEQEPLLKQHDLIGGGVYVEYRTDDARLTIEVDKAAKATWCYMFNYMKALSYKEVNFAFFTVDGGRSIDGEKHIFRAKKVVNATGPWVDDVRALDGKIENKHLILSKGVHIVFDA